VARSPQPTTVANRFNGRLVRLIGVVLSLLLARERGAGAGLARGDVSQFETTSVTSPDGGCTVSTLPYIESSNKDARLFLRCGQLPRKLLCSYFRTGVVIWSPDSSRIIFFDEHSPHEYAVRLFRTLEAASPNVDVVDRAVRSKIVSQLRGKEIVSYYLNFARFIEASHMILDADVIFIRKGETAPAHEMAFRFDVDLNTLAIEQTRIWPVN
jgi:hypothetical protein